MYHVAIDVMTECTCTRFKQKKLTVYTKTYRNSGRYTGNRRRRRQIKELAKVMEVYRAADLEQYKLEAQLFLLPQMLHAMGQDTSRFDITTLRYTIGLKNSR